MQLLQPSNKKKKQRKVFPRENQLIFTINLRIPFISVDPSGISSSPSLSVPAQLPCQGSQSSSKDRDRDIPEPSSALLSLCHQHRAGIVSALPLSNTLHLS